MKKVILILLILQIVLLSGCSRGNQKIHADDYNFSKAMIKLTDDTIITVDVDTYTCSENSVLIVTKDGTKYGVAYTDVTFID